MSNKNVGNFLKSKYFGKQKYDNTNIGPGSYNFNYTIIKKRPFSCKFGTEKKNYQRIIEGAEPGTYNPNFEVNKQKS